MSTFDAALSYVRENREGILDGFQELLSIPSISADPAYAGEIARCADWIIAEMQRIGLNNCAIYPTTGHPAVYGEWLEAGPDKPTILFYAHFDVQPVDPLNEWVTPPFEPDIRDGNLYARGAVDNKQGVWINLKIIEAYLQAGGLPFNVKVFFEGEEEIGSPDMEAFIADHQELLAADLMLMTDGGSEIDQPEICYGVRGIVAAEVEVTGPKADLHSGMYGGVVHNPLHKIGEIIGSFHDEQGRIQIPGFYNAVRDLTPNELDALLVDEPDILTKAIVDTGLEQFWAEDQGSYIVRATSLPTLDINGITGGYQGPGNKTVLPAKGSFKVTMRLVADQDPKVIMQSFVDHVKSFDCDTLDITVKPGAYGYPCTMLFDGPAVEAVHQAYEATWDGKRAKLTRTGGSVPILGIFQRYLNMPMVTIGYGVGGGIHSPNEYFILAYFYRALEMGVHTINNIANTDL